jgi:hypothetical protein
MGYEMWQGESKFKILNENKVIALNALKKLAKTQKDLGSVDKDIILKSEALDEALFECRWNIEENENGDVKNINFCGNKLGEEGQIFQAIAPFVENGSYIEMCGEDCCIWRWAFKNSECRKITPKFVWTE